MSRCFAAKSMADAIDGIVKVGCQRWGGRNVRVVRMSNAAASDEVIQRVSEFSLTPISAVPAFKVELHPTSKKFVDGLAKKQRRQITDKINSLAHDPEPPDSQTLQQTDYRRVDSGEYRVIYRRSEATIEIRRVGKRNDDEVYRGLLEL